MKNIIVVTGASSGFGAMTARALAQAGHTVYASMRDTAGRNAPQVANALAYAKEHGVDLRTIELDVGSQNPRMRLSPESFRTTGGSTSSFTTPDT